MRYPVFMPSQELLLKKGSYKLVSCTIIKEVVEIEEETT